MLISIEEIDGCGGNSLISYLKRRLELLSFNVYIASSKEKSFKRDNFMLEEYSEEESLYTLIEDFNNKDIHKYLHSNNDRDIYILDRYILSYPSNDCTYKSNVSIHIDTDALEAYKKLNNLNSYYVEDSFMSCVNSKYTNIEEIQDFIKKSIIIRANFMQKDKSRIYNNILEKIKYIIITL